MSSNEMKGKKKKISEFQDTMIGDLERSKILMNFSMVLGWIKNDIVVNGICIGMFSLNKIHIIIELRILV